MNLLKWLREDNVTFSFWSEVFLKDEQRKKDQLIEKIEGKLELLKEGKAL